MANPSFLGPVSDDRTVRESRALLLAELREMPRLL
jgi:hypothetical protein